MCHRDLVFSNQFFSLQNCALYNYTKEKLGSNMSVTLLCTLPADRVGLAYFRLFPGLTILFFPFFS